jgi:acetolactate synthase-1/2/3 large subunit
MTTPKGKGIFPESHPLSLGVFGHGGHPSSAEYLEGGVDVLLAVGTGLSDPATDGWSPLLNPSEHFIQIDTDALQMGRNYPVSVGLVGRADSVLEQIRAHLTTAPRLASSYGVRRYTDPATETSPRITPARAIWELQQILPEDTVYTCDIGEHLLFSTHYLKIDQPDGFVVMTGLASMGTGIAGALGIKLAQRERPVAAIVGDGCFAMSVGDLATAAREKVPMVIAVLNDGRYGMVELGNLSIYGRTPPYPTCEIDVKAFAQSVGAEAVVIEKPGDILGLSLEGRVGPLVLDVRVDPEARMPNKNKRFEELALAARRGRRTAS